MNQKVQAQYKNKGEQFDNFFDSLTFEYKLLKKLIHEGQMNCFGNQSLSRKQAEDCSKDFMQPYFHVRQQISEKLQLCDKQFQAQESRCTTSTDDVDVCYQTLIESLKICLNNQIPQARLAYKTVFKDLQQ